MLARRLSLANFFKKDFFLSCIGFFLAQVPLTEGFPFLGCSYLAALFFEMKGIRPLLFLSVVMGYIVGGKTSLLLFLFFFFLLFFFLFAPDKGSFRAFSLTFLFLILLWFYWREDLFSIILLREIFLFFFFLFLFHYGLQVNTSSGGELKEIDKIYAQHFQELGDLFASEKAKGSSINHYLVESFSSGGLSPLTQTKTWKKPRYFIDSKGEISSYLQSRRPFQEKLLAKGFNQKSKEKEALLVDILACFSKGLGKGVIQGPLTRKERDLYFLSGLASSSQEEISGDSHVIVTLPDGRRVVGLSDGLGTGLSAYQKSNRVLRIIYHLLSLGIQEEEALHILNLFCLLSYHDEEYTTLDLAIFSPLYSRVSFYKFGASFSFIKRGRQISTISSSSLPLGVTKEPVKSVSRKIKREDQIILVTDGILDVNRHEILKEEWLLEALKEAPLFNPQELADFILDRAKDQVYEESCDDMTVLVFQGG